MNIRPAEARDHPAVFAVLEPIVRAGETLAMPRDADDATIMAHWVAPDRDSFVAEEDGQVLGVYFLKANTTGGGAHVGNCGYATSPAARGRGIARAMCAHSLDHARARGFRAIQFNFVIATNGSAVHLWQAMGFDIVGRVPGAFLHPRLGYVDALVMHRAL